MSKVLATKQLEVLMDFYKLLKFTFDQLKRIFKWVNDTVSFSIQAFLCPELIWKCKR